jgi:hypothetical protein
MKTVGQVVEETINLCDRGLDDFAFVSACDAVRQTAAKVYLDQQIPEPEFQRFIRDNWRLISFMGIPRTDPIPVNLPFSIRRSVTSLNIHNLVEEIVIFSARQSLATRRMPPEITFGRDPGIVIKEDKLYFPKSLIFALLGSVILNPVNKDESVPAHYWINIWDFKMFTSELWGRMDLAERIMNLYSK